MRLVNKLGEIVGGRRYTYEDEKGNRFEVTGFDLDWTGFEHKIRSSMKNNNVAIPENLMDYVEDQICGRQPPGRCRYEKKAGDQLAKTIHVFARAADKVAGAVGVKTHIERTLRGCSGCSKRRVAMNK